MRSALKPFLRPLLRRPLKRSEWKGAAAGRHGGTYRAARRNECKKMHSVWGQGWHYS